MSAPKRLAPVPEAWKRPEVYDLDVDIVQGLHFTFGSDGRAGCQIENCEGAVAFRASEMRFVRFMDDLVGQWLRERAQRFFELLHTLELQLAVRTQDLANADAEIEELRGRVERERDILERFKKVVTKELNTTPSVIENRLHSVREASRKAHPDLYPFR